MTLFDSFLELSPPIRALLANFAMLLETALLELACWREVKKFYTQNPELYHSALRTNIVSHFSPLSIAMYTLIANYNVDKTPHGMFQRALKFVGMIWFQGLFYYYAHRAFHKVKGLYWIHSYHHKFKDTVLPSATNAVSIWEYTIAYLTPFYLATWMMKPDRATVLVAMQVVHLGALLAHFPPFLEVKLPWFLLSASEHKRHHIKLNTEFGGPFFHVDRVMWSSLSAMGGRSTKSE